jgi:hypothetical protein
MPKLTHIGRHDLRKLVSLLLDANQDTIVEIKRVAPAFEVPESVTRLHQAVDKMADRENKIRGTG